MKNIMIGIQARSTSKRLPNKVNFMLDDMTVLNQVLNHCKSAVSFINEKRSKEEIRAFFCLLIPAADPIKNIYKNVKIIEGPEDDVLTRYVNAAEILQADYIVRITGDCPLLPAPLITRHVDLCLANQFDYFSNVDDKIRTFIDGLDVEVFSKRVLMWLNQYAKDIDREHVTSLYRKKYPKEFKTGHLVNYIDMSDIKLSVDTDEDFEKVKQSLEKIKKKLDLVRSWGHVFFRY